MSLAETCEKAVSRAAMLTAQMRAFGKVQNVALETIDPVKLVQAAMPLLKNALPENIDLSVDYEDGIWPVTVDPLQFELSLLNIVVNARDAIAHQNGRVRIELHNMTVDARHEVPGAGEYVQISILDNGAGMTPDILSKALEPFFTIKEVDKGTGLGLPQAYGFAEQSNGKLILESEPGRGTAVTIYLPRAKGALTADPDVQRKSRELRRAGTVLFVEDDPLVREAVVPALRRAGFEVEVAANGHEALSVLESGRDISVVFSDIVMPGTISGIELARTVRERFPETPVILATGYTDRQVDVPGVHLIAKPYDVDAAIELLSTAA